jgi:hypothetical protein
LAATKHHDSAQVLAPIIARHPEWRSFGAGNSVDVEPGGSAYIHGAIVEVNRSFRKRWKFTEYIPVHIDYTMRRLADRGHAPGYSARRRFREMYTMAVNKAVGPQPDGPTPVGGVDYEHGEASAFIDEETLNVFEREQSVDLQSVVSLSGRVLSDNAFDGLPVEVRTGESAGI